MRDIEVAIYEAFLRRGWIIPTTAREVALVESLFPDPDPADLPERLRTPPPLPTINPPRSREHAGQSQSHRPES